MAKPMTWQTSKDRAMQTLNLSSVPDDRKRFWRKQVQRLDAMAAEAERLKIANWRTMKIWDLRAEIYWRRKNGAPLGQEGGAS